MNTPRTRIIGRLWDILIVDNEEVTQKLLGNGIVNATVINRFPGIVFVNEEFELLAPHVQKAIVAHELGHVINGDLNSHIRGRHTESEVLADLRAVSICGKDPVLEYLYLIRDQTIKTRRIFMTDPFKKAVFREIIKELADSLIELNHRIQYVQETENVRYTQV